MMSRKRLASCDRPTCSVCQLYMRLVNDGASPCNESSLSEGQCSINICFNRNYQCKWQLKLDEARAQYRLRCKGREQTKMCDFAITARQEKRIVIVVVEIKNTASVYAISQLQAGLDVIYRYLSPKWRESVCQPKAYVIANRGIPQFKHLLRAKIYSQISLKFGHFTFRPEVEKCEASLSV